MESENRSRLDNSLRTMIATTAEQVQHALVVRGICFMEEEGLPVAVVLDGNDLLSTHVVLYDGDEPIGSSRIRWFADFAKIERTCLRKSHRNLKVLRHLGRFIFAHVAQKGYARVLTHADESYSRLWIKLFGFRPVTGKDVFETGKSNPLIELVKELEPAPDPVTLMSSPSVLFRQEGSWDVPSVLG